MRQFSHIGVWFNTQIDLYGCLPIGIRLAIESQLALYIGRIGKIYSCISFLRKQNRYEGKEWDSSIIE